MKDLVLFIFMIYGFEMAITHIVYSLERLKDIRLWIFNIILVGFIYIGFLPFSLFIKIITVIAFLLLLFSSLGFIFYLLYRIMKRFRAILENILGE